MIYNVQQQLINNKVIMSAMPSPHPASVDAYIRQGWSLVPVPPGTKGPRTQGWNKKENTIKSQSDLPSGYGIGIAHAYSGTMALDIDNWGDAVEKLATLDINLTELYTSPNAVVIDSGRSGHGKLLYAMPFGMTLPSKKLIKNSPDGGQYNYLDFRCGTANGLTVQDILPPSIHPDTGQPYRWSGYGQWSRLPLIPQPLLDFWMSLLEQDKHQITESDISTDWVEIQKALEIIPADISRKDWVTIGMALHWAGTASDSLPQALQLWNDWSKQSETKYPGEKGILTQWSSFRSDKENITRLGTLFHIAKIHGYSSPAPSIEGLFGPNEPNSPIELKAGLVPKAPNMNLDLWPPVLVRRASEIAESVGCDPLVPLWAGLSAVAGVADARSRLELMHGYRVPPILWVMTIGDPADKKSPGSRPMFNIMHELEAADKERFAKDLLDWEGKEAAHEGSKKAFLTFASSPESMFSPNDAPLVVELPHQPVPLRIKISDITSQKLVRQAADRPRGLLCHLDEMASWVHKLTDNRSGEDRSSWVVSYEGERYEMDRVGAGSIHCENLAVSIYGNMQPDVLKDSFRSLCSDGLLQRFIPVPLRGSFTKVGEPIPDYLTNKSSWDTTLRLIFSLPTTTYKLSEDSYKIFREFQYWYESAKQDERLLSSGTAFMTAFGKLEGTAGRLILLFHLIENPFSNIVNVSIVERVVQIVKTYIIPSLRYTLNHVADSDNFDTWLADYVIQYATEKTLSLSDIKRSARRQIEQKMTPWQVDTLITEAMDNLEKSDWVKRIEGSEKRPLWAINPKLADIFKQYREALIRARQRQLDQQYDDPRVKSRKFVKGFKELNE